ncbi:VOC family protein [Nocardia sp. CDC159]|uniref:VOC family protein n=1 Tax=Nocardia pulmonis TaxID=2951408 RepID=A0A9X2E3K1_9NOCA|nr:MULTISPECIES: VOC family protein [Nocardia]MCM6773622.1 VOC family protein [Nocardia pulmonis]MCM6786509.1 VOC family protein [Nocardia sp. CDC159]
MHLTQIRLIVDDFARTCAYYRDVIGLTPQDDQPAPPYVAFKPELGSSLCLHDRTDLDAALGGALRTGLGRTDVAVVSLRVDDLDAYLAGLRERGAEIAFGPVVFGDRIRCAYLRDPEENLIEIQQWLSTRSGAPVPPAC